MINSSKSTKVINSFQYVAIPSPRDLFAKYGERINSNGSFSCDSSGGSPQLVSSSSVIDQMINAQHFLQNDCATV